MAGKYGQLRETTLVDSNGQKCRCLDGCVASVCGHAANVLQVAWPHRKDGYQQLG